MQGTGKRRKRGFYGRLKLAETYLESLWSGPDSRFRSLWSHRAKYLRLLRSRTGSTSNTVSSTTRRNISRSHYHPRNAMRSLRAQPRLILASYACGFLGVLLSLHDYHHYHADHFGFSTPFLGAAILLYLVGNQRPR